MFVVAIYWCSHTNPNPREGGWSPSTHPSCVLLDKVDATIVHPLQQTILKDAITEGVPGTAGRNRTEATLGLNSTMRTLSGAGMSQSPHGSYWVKKETFSYLTSPVSEVISEFGLLIKNLCLCRWDMPCVSQRLSFSDNSQIISTLHRGAMRSSENSFSPDCEAGRHCCQLSPWVLI